MTRGKQTLLIFVSLVLVSPLLYYLADFILLVIVWGVWTAELFNFIREKKTGEPYFHWPKDKDGNDYFSLGFDGGGGGDGGGGD